MKFLFFILFIFGSQMLFAEPAAESVDTEEIIEESFELEATERDRVENIEKIKVTGSRIKRIDMEGPSPVIIYNKEDLENSGYSTAGDFLRDTTVSHFGVSREEAGRSTSGESFAEIKGEASLILINGLRVAEDPNVPAVDLNMVPIHAIERVEILKDGASALYGSDAVGGVINFITRKDFSGTEIHAKLAPTVYPWYKGGSRADTALVFGSSNNEWSYISSLSARFQDSVENFERSWTNTTISPIGPYARLGGAGDPLCPRDLQVTNDKGILTGCEFNVADYSTRIPQLSQLYGYFHGDYKRGETRFYTQLIASYKNTKWLYAPVPGGLQLSDGQAIVSRFVEAGQRGVTYTSLIGDLTLGAEGYVSPTWDYDFNVKLAGTMKNKKAGGLLLKEELKQAINSGKYDPRHPDRVSLINQVLTSIRKGNFDPTKPLDPKRDLRSALYTAQSENSSTLLSGSLDLSGEAGFWDLELATGLQAYRKDFREKADKKAKEDKILSNAGSDGYGERYVISYYLEGVKHFSDKLEIQLAGRTDYYSDFGLASPFDWTLDSLFKESSNGETTDSNSDSGKENSSSSKLGSFPLMPFNPKLAFRFKAHPQVLIRGSLGTAFVAPSLHDLYSSSSEGYPSMFDTVACYNELKAKGKFNEALGQLAGKSDKEKDDFVKDFLIEQKEVINQKGLSKDLKKELKNLSEGFADTQYCRENQYFSSSKGNKDLKETKAVVASLGSVLQLTDEHNLTVDLWYVKKSGLPSYGLDKKTFDAELKLGEEHVKKNGVTINRDKAKDYHPLPSDSHGVETQLLNIASTQKSGIDLDWMSDMATVSLFNGTPYFADHFSYIFFSKEEGFPGIGFTDGIGKFGLPQWRNVATLGWKNERHNFSLTAHTVAPFAKKSSELENLKRYTRLDLDYQFIMSEKTSFQFGWSNLLFSTPPIDEGDKINKLDHDIFEARGPFIFAGIKHLI